MHEHYHALEGRKMWTRLDRLRKSPGVGFCEHGYATLGSYVGNVLIIWKTLVRF